MNLIKKTIPYFLATILILLIIYISRDQLSDFQRIKNLNILSILIISFLFILNQLLLSYKLKIFLENFNLNIPFIESFGLVSVQSVGNYLPMSGGIISNIVYLKKSKKFPISEYVSYIVGDTVIKTFTYSLFGSFLLLFLFLKKEIIYIPITLLFLTLICFTIIIIIIPKIKTNKIFLNWFIKVHEGWEKIKKNKRIIKKSILIHILSLTILSVQFKIIFVSLNYNIDIIPIIILNILTSIIRVASLFPGNLGLRESVSGFVMSSFGFSFSLGSFVSIIGRVICLFWIVIFGAFFSFFLIRNASSN